MGGGVVCLKKERKGDWGGEGLGWGGLGVGWGQAKEPASQYARVCQNDPLAYYRWISLATYRVQNPETPKSLKKVSREEFGTPRPRTPKEFEQKSEKSRNLTLLLTFRTLFSNFFGGPKLLSGGFFKTFHVFGVFGPCRWRKRS